jgi:hypothetical protein
MTETSEPRTVPIALYRRAQAEIAELRTQLAQQAGENNRLKAEVEHYATLSGIWKNENRQVQRAEKLRTELAEARRLVEMAPDYYELAFSEFCRKYGFDASRCSIGRQMRDVVDFFLTRHAKPSNQGDTMSDGGRFQNAAQVATENPSAQEAEKHEHQWEYFTESREGPYAGEQDRECRCGVVEFLLEDGEWREDRSGIRGKAFQPASKPDAVVLDNTDDFQEVRLRTNELIREFAAVELPSDRTDAQNYFIMLVVQQGIAANTIERALRDTILQVEAIAATIKENQK